MSTTSPATADPAAPPVNGADLALEQALAHYEEGADPYVTDLLTSRQVEPNARIMARLEAELCRLRRHLAWMEASRLRWRGVAITALAVLGIAIAVKAIRQAGAWELVCGKAACSALEVYERQGGEEPYAGVVFHYAGGQALVVGSNLWGSEGQKAVTIGLEVDGGPLSTTTGLTRGQQVIVMITPEDVRRLAAGRTLRVSTLGARYPLGLRGSAAAIELAMRETAVRRARGALPPVPAAPQRGVGS